MSLGITELLAIASVMCCFSVAGVVAIGAIVLATVKLTKKQE